MWRPGVDGVVAGRADDKGLAPPPCHQFRPRGLWLSRLAEVGEFADLVHVHLARVPADLAPVRQEPGDLWVPKTRATWPDALLAAGHSAPRQAHVSPVLACRGVG